jgi:hypothetical protein
MGSRADSMLLRGYLLSVVLHHHGWTCGYVQQTVQGEPEFQDIREASEERYHVDNYHVTW